MAAELPSDEPKGCAELTPRILIEAGKVMSPLVLTGITALAPLPTQTAQIVCAWVEIAAAGQISRSDTLWFQAGYGGAPGDLGSGAPAFPKWDSPNPSLFRASPGELPLDPNPFSRPAGR
ncbi:MAG: hypothetical protein P4L76_03210 [Beijerinckiaceae bacterium]|nr:hypothetical protein [Beijerinckiaceae bacterium]